MSVLNLNLLRRLIVLVFLCLSSLVVVGAIAGPAEACRPAIRPLGQQLADAEVVFSGMVTAVPQSSGKDEPAIYVVKADTSYRGDVATAMTVELGPSVCGDLLHLRQGERYLFVGSASDKQGVVTATNLGGTQEFTEATQALVVKTLGGGTAPTAAPRTTATDTDDGSTSLTRLDRTQPRELVPAMTPGLILALGGTVIFLLARVLGSVRSKP